MSLQLDFLMSSNACGIIPIVVYNAAENYKPYNGSPKFGMQASRYRNKGAYRAPSDRMGREANTCDILFHNRYYNPRVKLSTYQEIT